MPEEQPDSTIPTRQSEIPNGLEILHTNCVYKPKILYDMPHNKSIRIYKDGIVYLKANECLVSLEGGNDRSKGRK